MSSTTETRSVPTYQLFYSRPGSLTPPTTSLRLPKSESSSPRARPPLSLPSSLCLPRGPARTASHPSFISSALSLVEERLERLDIHLATIYPFNAQRLRYAPSRYLIEFAQFILNCAASSNTSPNWEAALTILIRRHVIQRRDASPVEVDRYRRVVQRLIETACEPDGAISLFRNEGIEEDIWARGMSGTAGSIGSSGKRAKLPSHVDDFIPKSHQVGSDRVRAALADFFDLQRFGIDTWEELSDDEEATAYLMESLSIVEHIFSSGSMRVAGSSPVALDARATPDSIKPVSKPVVSDVHSTTSPSTVLTSDSEGGHSVQCDTTPPTTPTSSSAPSTSRTTSKIRSNRAIRPRRKPRTKPTPPELLGLELSPSTYPTPNLLSRRKPHSPSSVLVTPATSSPAANVAPVGGTIVQPGSTFAQRKSYAVQFRTHQNRVAEFEEACDAPFSTLNTTLCFMNPEERRRLDKGRTPLERQINSERRRAVWGHVVRTVGPAEVRDEEVWSEIGGKLRGMVHSWDGEWQAGHRERFGRKAGLAAGQSGRGVLGGARRSSEDRAEVNRDAWKNEELSGEVARGDKGKKGMSLWEAPGWKRWPPTLASSSDSDESFP
ncbi:hypothetical protein FRC05_008326 [Tulasnella sp. 425]|nr:hypothetical protein FRC05_008326 [Tulasnella sp. 425]